MHGVGKDGADLATADPPELGFVERQQVPSREHDPARRRSRQPQRRQYEPARVTTEKRQTPARFQLERDAVRVALDAEILDG